MENVDLDALIGKSLDNRFELKKLIGQGGYGAVFEAVQTSMQRRCAVKVLSIQTDDPKQIARFELEARVTCQLKHPNTIVVYEYGRDEELGMFFIAMEYLDGQSLTQLANSRSLSIEESLYILEQIAASLDDAHSYDLVHRDIKPHNIMIVKRGADDLCVKVIDFGIAKTRDTGLDLTQTDAIIGTPRYMSTEQVLNQELTGKSDQYALAVTAYFLLTGQTVFNYDTAIQVAVAHASEIPPKISTVTDRFLNSEKFDTSLLRALSKDPHSRFDTCAEFIQALREHRPEKNPDSASHPILSARVKNPRLSTAAMKKAVARTEVGSIESVEDHGPQKGVKQNTSASLSAIKKSQSNSKIFFALALFMIFVIVMGIFLLGYKSKENSKLAYNNTSQAETIHPTENLPAVENNEQIDSASKPQTTPTNEKEEPTVVVGGTIPIAETEQETEQEPEPEPPKEDKAVVKIYTKPWGDIYVNGRKRSSKTRYTIKLSEGTHTFLLKQNGVSKAKKRVKITAGKNRKIYLHAEK